MTASLETVLERIADNKGKRGYKLQPPCPEGAIESLKRAIQKRFSFPLPKSYADLLRRMNGIDFNGALIFAAMTVPHASLSGRQIEGLLEANVIRRENAENFLIFGESGMEMYVWDLPSSAWETVDQVSLDVFDQHETFDNMIASALEKRLPK